MKESLRQLTLTLAPSLVAFTLTLGPAHAADFTVRCEDSGDAFGYAVDASGDFNGDGRNDVIVGAPCAPRGTGDSYKPRAGMVKVFSGRNGRRLFVGRGREADLYMGYSVAFIDDLNGDGKDEILIGSPGYDLTPQQNPDPFAGPVANAGRVEIFVGKGRKRFRFLGTQPQGGFGSSVDGIGDVDGDGRADVVIGASNERADKAVRPGKVYVYSGRSAELIASAAGEKGGELFGSALAATPDVDGDGIDDIIIGAPARNMGGISNTGLAVVMHGDLSGTPILERAGTRKDNLGESVDDAGDRDGDGLAEVVVGAVSGDGSGFVGAGEVLVYDGDGNLLMAAVDSQPQENAHFGKSVANLGDLTGDGIDDFAVGAPDYDIPQTQQNVPVQPDTGRTVALSGADGTVLWAVDGADSDGHLGYAVAGGLDFNRDGTPDAVAGATRADFRGRRGAGAVSILSGDDGDLLRIFGGGHGRETRLYFAEDTRLYGFSPDGVLKTPQAQYAGIGGEMSIAVIDDTGKVFPGEVLIAVGSGHKGRNGEVAIFNAGRKQKPVDRFDALSSKDPIGTPGSAVGGGVNVAAGRFSFADDDRDRLVAAQADSNNGDVMIRVFKRFDEQDGWFLDSQFNAFSKDELFPVSPTVGLEINAKGGTVSVGDVHENPGDEIVVGTEEGLPVIRVFTGTGELLSEWLAFDPVDADGVQVCVGNVAPFGRSDVIAVPSDGRVLIKVFGGNGERLPVPNTNDDISIVPPTQPGFTRGGRACGADVDYDDVEEIVYVPSPGVRPIVHAFELDGSTPIGWESFEAPGSAIATTDNFVRN